MPSRVIFGIGAVERTGTEVKKMKAKNILIVTDRGVAKAGLADKVKGPMLEEGLKVDVWDRVEPEPSIGCVEELLEYVKGGNFDLLIGVGGGSSMDVAKAAAVLLKNPGEPEEYFAGGEREFTNPGVPCIAIPTTAGTGAEITWDAVIKDRTGMKAFFEHQYVRPTLAIVDPIMSSGMPPRLTAASGIDALSHAVESALTRITNPITMALALQAIRLISANLRVAVHHGSNLEARYNMALATLAEAFSETNAGDIEAHAIGHLIGSVYGIPHGVACGLVLPYAMEFNIVVSADRLKLIADAMGEDVRGLTDREAAYRGIHAVRQLIEDVDLPTTLKEVGVKREDIPKLAEDMTTIPWIKVFFDYFTIREMTKEAGIELLESIWEGRLGET
ncbi:MAG: iron-containing alcohol dehydrogenase [Candidatus Bathyarchaeota archaeon]|nr:iron-containing alcohol dehydrogenase [Candidatus Bathyarchaeota archaeon]